MLLDPFARRLRGEGEKAVLQREIGCSRGEGEDLNSTDGMGEVWMGRKSVRRLEGEEEEVEEGGRREREVEDGERSAKVSKTEPREAGGRPSQESKFFLHPIPAQLRRGRRTRSNLELIKMMMMMMMAEREKLRA